MMVSGKIGAGPEYYFDHAAKALEDIAAGVFLFLDFDGTLTPIQRNPGACTLEPEVKELLASLAASASCRVAVLSGRSLADIQKRVPVEGVTHGGNHGLAIEGPGLSFIHPDAIRTRNAVRRIGRLVRSEISGLEGPWVEDKGVTFTLHLRGAGQEAGILARRAFNRVISISPQRRVVSILKGKKALELLPLTTWDKGRAAIYILDASGGMRLPLYVGDDTTDESAFRALAPRGITIRVGRSKSTSAQYFLKGQGEIIRFLRNIDSVCRANQV
jgi:trehalose 6-phosphate phosphatase